MDVARRDAMSRLTEKTLDDFAAQDDLDPDEEIVDDYDEETGFFPSLFDKQ